MWISKQKKLNWEKELAWLEERLADSNEARDKSTAMWKGEEANWLQFIQDLYRLGYNFPPYQQRDSVRQAVEFMKAQDALNVLRNHSTPTPPGVPFQEPDNFNRGSE